MVTGEVINQATGAAMACVTVKLFDPAGDPVGGTVITGTDGTYAFSVAAGNYLIQKTTPTGFYQANPTFPNYPPTNQSTNPVFGNNPNNWNYNGNGGATPPPGWVINGTPAPFESALNITGPTVDLGYILKINHANTLSYTELLKNSAAGDPGYQIQATAFAGTPNVTVNGTAFALSNFHFHAPTKNLVNGVAPGVMEEHFIKVGASGGESVLVVFMKIGTTPNQTFENLFGSLKNLGTAGGSSLPGSTVGSINFAELLPTNLQGWFYPGSLTTPPLATPVNWFVFQTPIELTQAEFNEYTAYATAAGFHPNARPTQDLAGRVFNSLKAVTVTSSTDIEFAKIINATVPEPSSVALMGLGMTAVAGRCWRSRRRGAVPIRSS